MGSNRCLKFLSCRFKNWSYANLVLGVALIVRDAYSASGLILSLNRSVEHTVFDPQQNGFVQYWLMTGRSSFRPGEFREPEACNKQSAIVEQ